MERSKTKWQRVNSQTHLKLNDHIRFSDGTAHLEGRISGTVWYNGRRRLMITYLKGMAKINIPLAGPYFVTHREVS